MLCVLMSAGPSTRSFTSLFMLNLPGSSYSPSRAVYDAKLDLAFSLRRPLGQLQSTMRWLFAQINWRKVDSLMLWPPSWCKLSWTVTHHDGALLTALLLERSNPQSQQRNSCNAVLKLQAASQSHCTTNNTVQLAAGSFFTSFHEHLTIHFTDLLNQVRSYHMLSQISTNDHHDNHSNKFKARGEHPTGPHD